MVKPLRHRQTKGAATAMFYLMPPRHISTLTIADLSAALNDVRFTPDSGHSLERRSLPLCAIGLNRSRGSALWRTAGPTRVSICSSGPKMQHDDIRTAKDSNDEIHTI